MCQDAAEHFAAPDFQVISTVIYHNDLLCWPENTATSKNDLPFPFYMFEFHRDRMLAAIADLPSPPAAMRKAIEGDSGLENMREAARRVLVPRPLRLRFELKKNGSLGCSSFELGPLVPLHKAVYFPSSLPDPSTIKDDDIKWTVYMAKDRVTAGYATRHKTNHREIYNQALKNAQVVIDYSKVGRRGEVLVVNKDDQVMEGCTTTAYFWRDGKWVTPHADCGGNLGVTRRWALSKGLAVEAIVYRNVVREGELIMLSNGVRGFSVGKIATAEDIAAENTAVSKEVLQPRRELETGNTASASTTAESVDAGSKLDEAAKDVDKGAIQHRQDLEAGDTASDSARTETPP